MKRKLTSILLFSALLAGGASTFVSCTDNESDNAYNTSATLAGVIAQQKTELEKLNTELAKKVDQATYDAEKAAIEERIKKNEDLLNNTALKDLAAYGTLNEAIEASEAYNGLKSEIAAIQKLQAEDKEAAEKMEKALLDSIKSLGSRVSSIEEMDAKMQTALDYLVNKNLANVAINATENPVTGYWNAAFLGSQLNLASSFYGTAAQGSKTFGVEGGDVLGKNGNAGYIYVSLNPTELDPACITKLTLVDSQGNEADGFKLGDLENTNKVLTYGYSRAAATSANGFYQIPVIATDPKKPFDLNKGELAAVAKDVLAELKNPKANNFQLREAAKALYGAGSSINNALKAYTVKAEYYLYDATTGELVKKSQVAPTYNVAAFNVKPLSFNFLKDNEKLNNLGQKFAGFSLENYAIANASDKLRSFAQALNVEITSDKADNFYVYSVLASNNIVCKQEGKDVVMYKHDDSWSEVNDGDFTYWTWTAGESGKEAYHTFPNSTLEVEKHLSNGVEEYVYVIKTKDNTIADMLAEVNKQLSDKLSPVQDKLNAAADRYDNVIGHVSDLISRIGAKVGSANKLLQPTILYIGNDGKYHPMSTIGGRLGTRLVGVGETTIFATSWNAELLAPAYKKSVSIDGGAEVTLVDGTSAAKPFAGSTSKLVLNIKKAGNYTITYKAVDYSGVEVEKTFHVTAVAE